MSRDILTTILENQKLFELYTSTQDDISTFLISEKGKREKIKRELQAKIDSEKKFQEQAIESIMKTAKTYGKQALHFVSEELTRGQLRAQLFSQEIDMICNDEMKRRIVASDEFNSLLDCRFRVEEAKRLFPYLNKSEYDYPEKIYKPGTKM